MKIDAAVMDALEVLERDRGVPIETILDALANALVSAYKRTPGSAKEARVTIDADSGDIVVYAQKLDDDRNVVQEWEDTPTDFGRIAAQTAKAVISQRIREAKRDQVFSLYGGREMDLVTGIVQQVEGRVIILDLGDAEALMPIGERIPYEKLERGNRVKALILEVRSEGKGPQIIVSRSHPELVRRLLELEVPELVDGIIEITEIAREPGHRTKISVISHDPNVDPKGACVGARGGRVRQVVNELRGEKVDVVHWRNDPSQFVIESLGPAKVKEVHIDEDQKVAHVLVSSHQLSLAIGKEGQNARLAARLSGYKIDIRSDRSDQNQVDKEPSPSESDTPGEKKKPPVKAGSEPASDDVPSDSPGLPEQEPADPLAPKADSAPHGTDTKKDPDEEPSSTESEDTLPAPEEKEPATEPSSQTEMTALNPKDVSGEENSVKDASDQSRKTGADSTGPGIGDEGGVAGVSGLSSMVGQSDQPDTNLSSSNLDDTQTGLPAQATPPETENAPYSSPSDLEQAAPTDSIDQPPNKTDAEQPVDPTPVKPTPQDS